MNTADRVSELMKSVHELAPVIRQHTAALETERRLPDPLRDAMASRGLLRLCVPAEHGGHQADPATQLRILHTVAQVNASAAWNLMIALQGSLFAAASLSNEAVGALVSDPLSSIDGSLEPTGKAYPAGDGYRPPGEWKFVSGCDFSTWIACPCVVVSPQWTFEIRILWIPTEQCVIKDTWSVLGLQGTGSHTVVASNVLVPKRLSCPLGGALVREDALYRFPMYALFALQMGAIALGISRCALDEVITLVQTKPPTGGAEPLRNLPRIQTDVAHAEAHQRAGSAFLYHATEEAWRAIEAAQTLTDAQIACLRLAASHATETALKVVGLAYRMGGTTSIQTGGTLERCLRDINTLSQHNMIGPAIFEATGQVLVGLELPDSLSR